MKDSHINELDPQKFVADILNDATDHEDTCVKIKKYAHANGLEAARYVFQEIDILCDHNKLYVRILESAILMLCAALCIWMGLDLKGLVQYIGLVVVVLLIGIMVLFKSGLKQLRQLRKYCHGYIAEKDQAIRLFEKHKDGPESEYHEIMHEGVAAAESQQGSDTNPYEKDSEESAYWRAGWLIFLKTGRKNDEKE